MKDMSYLKSLPIAVLGGGAAGRSHAADCTLAGQSVRMFEFEEFAPALGKIMENHKIEFMGPQVNIYNFERSGTAVIDVVTTNMAEAVKGAGNIIVALPALAFNRLFELLIPTLEDGQVIHFMSGNFGSLMLRKMMKEMNCTKDVIIGEWSSQPYSTRVKTFAGVALPQVNVVYRAVSLRGAALPYKDTEEFFEAMKYLGSMDSVVEPEKGYTALDVCFSNVNPVLHCPGTILGASVMENFAYLTGKDAKDFSIYSHAYSPSVSEVQYAFYAEQKLITDAIGITLQEHKKEEFFSRTSVLGKEFLGEGSNPLIKFDERCELFERTGPYTIQNRYITEDIPVGCCIQKALGNKFGVETPVIDSMITLASIMTGRDFKNNCYTLETIGIADMDKEELLAYLLG